MNKSRSQVDSDEPNSLQNSLTKIPHKTTKPPTKTRSRRTSPTTSRGAPAHQFLIHSPQTRKSLTVSSRRSFPERDLLNAGPTFPCRAPYRLSRTLGSAPATAPIRRVPSVRHWPQNLGTT
uniref:Uncharacterized protein n=1 Tax=Arundo donax TaxID=35708 RepID=A0A0A9DPW1_ARUDO